MTTGQYCPICGRVYGIEAPFCEVDLSALRRGTPPERTGAIEQLPWSPADTTAVMANPLSGSPAPPAPPAAAAPMRTSLDAAPQLTRVLALIGGARLAVNAGKRLVIGRDPSLESAGACAAYDNISRIHCTLELSDGTLMVTDLGSSNGTFVDSMRIAPQTPTPVPAGSTLRLAANVVVDIIR